MPAIYSMLIRVRKGSLSVISLFGLYIFSASVIAAIPGATPGEFRVDNTGAASYSIPIVVPPGTAGVQPNLRFNYSSRRGNGLLGVGWTTSGVSAITRCGKSIAQDDDIHGVNFSSEDRFCLGGRKLIAISGTYGADGTEYRTELDTFSKIVSYNSGAINGPEKFKVWTRSGEVRQYGYEADSRIEAQGRSDGAVRVWAMDRATDVSGNYLKVSYIEDSTNGEFRCDEIEYTGHSVTPVLAPFASVKFIYETRTDIRVQYQAGSQIKTTKRLDKIETYEGANKVRTYDLSYNYDGAADRSRLDEIQECDGMGACLPSIDLSWLDGNSTYFDPAVLTSNWGDYSLYTPYIGDVDGDGLSDIIAISQSSSAMYIRVSRSNGDGTYSTATTTTNWGDYTLYTPYIGDVDGDGLSDIIAIAQTSSAMYLRVAKSNGDGSYAAATTTTNWGDYTLYTPYIGDVDGDGLSDIIAIAQTSSAMYLRVGRSNGDGTYASAVTTTNLGNLTAYTPFIGDADGDGQADIIAVAITTSAIYTHVALSNGDGSYQTSVGTTVRTGNYTAYSPYIGDSNGDGLSDVILIASTTSATYTHVSLSNGDATYRTTVGTTINTGNYTAYTPYLGDANGDRLVDIITLAHTSSALYSHVAISEGDGGYQTTVGMTISTGNYSSYTPHIGDAAGDGIADIINTSLSGSALYHMTVLNRDGMGDKVDRVTSSLGVKTDIVYVPLTDDTIYTKGTGAAYPDVDIQNTLYVVSSVASDNGNGSQQTTTYQYEGARVNLAGRGFLGFSEMVSTRDADAAGVTQIVNTSRYLQAYPFTGMLLSSEQALSSTKVIRTSSSTFVDVTDTSDDFVFKVTETGLNLPAGHPGIGIPYVQKVVVNNYEINHTTPQTSVTTVTRTVDSMDDFGNVTEGNVETSDGTVVFTRETNSSFHNDDTNWFIGRLICVSVEQMLPGGSNATRISGFQYNADGLLAKEVIEPGSGDISEPAGVSDCKSTSTHANIRLITTYGYDDFGNRTTVTVDDGENGIEKRTTTTTWGEWTDFENNVSTNNGRFAIKLKNDLDHEEHRDYDGYFGVLTALEGPNALETEWEYDDLGRQTRETRADGSVTDISRDWCNGFLGESSTLICPAGGALGISVSTGGAPDNLVISDALGRRIQTETAGFDSTATVITQTEYDDLGRLKRQSLPYHKGDTIYWQDQDYDEIGRVTSVRTPYESNNDDAETTTAYNGLLTTVTNAEAQKTEQLRNARGELVEVVQIIGSKDTATCSSDDLCTNYEYDPFGNLLDVEDPLSNPTVNTYDIRGRKLTMSDPDMGAWSYQYDSLGQLSRQTDARGQRTVMTYDTLGRITNRYDNADDDDPSHISSADAQTVWTYDGGTKGKGKLEKVVHYDGLASAGNIIESQDHVYGSGDGRLASTTTKIDENNNGDVADVGETYVMSQTYDSQGRLSTLTYPVSPLNANGLELTHLYTASGYLEEVCENVNTSNAGCDDSNDVSFWKAGSQNAFGQVSSMTFGNGVTSNHGYNIRTGVLDTIVTTKGMNTLQDLEYKFDKIGNLTSRKDELIKRREEFFYDGVNRLTTAELQDVNNNYMLISTESTTYDELGNIETKTGIAGSLLYEEFHNGSGEACETGYAQPGPHAVTTVAGKPYCYDANGNLVLGYNHDRTRDREITWSAYNKPTQIKEGSDLLNPDLTVGFVYGADRGRVRQTIDDGTTTTKKTYVGGVYEKVTTGSLVTHVHYIRAGGHPVAIYESDNNDAEDIRYLHRDHLGSVSLITNSTGAIVQQNSQNGLAYDAWGQRRKADDWGKATTMLVGESTPRGYTNHEHLDGLELIHMNGRVYDPEVGRFLSPDPFVQAPTNSQSYNRYSYVFNNPLSFVDPSGFWGGTTYSSHISSRGAGGFNAGSGFEDPGIQFNLNGSSDNSFIILVNLNLVTDYLDDLAEFYGYSDYGSIPDEEEVFMEEELETAGFSIGQPDPISRIFSRLSGIILRGAQAAENSAPRVEGPALEHVGDGATREEPSLWGFIVDRYRAATRWHFEGRNARNANLPITVNGAKASGGTKLPPEQSVLHDNGVGRPEEKYIFEDGREAVYDGDTGALIRNPEFGGTYNYVNPEVGAPWYTPRNLGHGVTDVVPYCVGGNNREGAGPSCF